MLLSASLLALFACVAHGESTTQAEKNETGLFHVDAVFPRNETYALSPHMPIMFAIRNTGIARYIEFNYDIELYNHEQNRTFEFYDREVSSDSVILRDPYFDYVGFTWMNVEGHWTLTWNFTYLSCSLDPVNRISTRLTGGRVEFTTINTTKELDIVAALKNDTCVPSAGGFALNVTQLEDSPVGNSFQWLRCGVIADTVRAQAACPVQIAEKAAESINTHLETHYCYGDSPASDYEGCRVPNGAQKSAIRGVASACTMSAVLGGLAYFLMFP
ncbi:hypothetical protein ESCO_001354 [Escovopsis weberi]|uniref:DUF7136 domain-containing protein n=1 Tax=Escovopsis weberi TaxID=150374 RepID=A0A0N0RTH8_ESCWE|nr:hypothetical protein ESCO_001354 [Escovopsis weberi]